jgi:hypothetical protein
MLDVILCQLVALAVGPVRNVPGVPRPSGGMPENIPYVHPHGGGGGGDGFFDTFGPLLVIAWLVMGPVWFIGSVIKAIWTRVEDGVFFEPYQGTWNPYEGWNVGRFLVGLLLTLPAIIVIVARAVR